MLDQKLSNIISWLKMPSVRASINSDFQCPSRDVFQARLDGFFQETKNPLLVAVVGELGNNSFDHNLGSWRDIAGAYFRHFSSEHQIIIADRGQGAKKTLSRIMPNIKSDKEALEIAFTKVISGRSPEQRGNGLKFVAAAVKDNKWRLSFYSGNALVRLENGKMLFEEQSEPIYGCLAVITY